MREDTLNPGSTLVPPPYRYSSAEQQGEDGHYPRFAYRRGLRRSIIRTGNEILLPASYAASSTRSRILLRIHRRGRCAKRLIDIRSVLCSTLHDTLTPHPLGGAPLHRHALIARTATPYVLHGSAARRAQWRGGCARDA